MYKQYKHMNEVITDAIIRITDNATIPFDLANKDYQDYLKWLDGYEQQFNPETHGVEWVLTTPGGNTPEPADE